MKQNILTLTIRSNKGLTLTELILSSILIGIVMVGMISFGFIIEEMQKTTSRSTSLSMEITSVISHITKNASLSIGNKTNPGIVVEDTTVADNDWISFRQDLQNTPANYNDDTWFVYRRDLTNNAVYTCTKSALDGPDPTGFPDCQANALELSRKIENIEFSFVHPDNLYTFPPLSLFVLIDMTAKYDPTSAVDPLDNPEYNITTQIHPSSHSW